MSFLEKLNFKSGFKKILSNTGYLFGEKVFNMGLSLLVGIWVARYLGPDDYGLWQYSQSLVALFTVFATMGTTQIVIRDLVEEPEKREGHILGTSFILMLTAGILTTLLVIAFGFWLNDERLTRLLIVIASTNLIFQSFQVFDYWFQSKVLSKYSVYARTISRIVVSILKILFILLSLSLIYFALTVIISGIITSTFWIYNYNRKGLNTKKWSFDAAYAKSLLKDAWPLIISGVSVAIYMKVDQVMLKNMVDDNAVGNYAVAVRLSELWYFIPSSIAASVFPAIIKSKKNSIDKYHRRLQYLYDVMAGIAIAIAIPMTFLSEFIILILFGPEYSKAGSVLAVHIWAGLFVFLGVARSRWIINENYQFYGMICTLFGAIANIVLNLWLIPVLGIMGAAWATVASQAIAAWILGYFITDLRISSKMIFKSILSVILVHRLYKSLKNILKEAQ